MAERRMFAKAIMDSDSFLDMPLSTQALYVHLCMRADDDGFVNGPRKIQRMVGCGDDDLKLLVAKKFIIPFDGVVVIKHWKINNYIRSDRYTETKYREEKSQLFLKPNGAYTLNPSDDCVPVTVGATKRLPSANHPDTVPDTSGVPVGIPDDSQLVYQTVGGADTSGIPDGSQPVGNRDTQIRLGKDRVGKDRLDKVKEGGVGGTESFADALDSIPVSPKKPRKPPVDLSGVLDRAGITGDVRKTYEDFIAMRNADSAKKIKTERTLELIIRKVNELASDDEGKIAILEQSIRKGYMDVFPVKTDNPGWKTVNSASDASNIRRPSNPFLDMLKEDAMKGEGAVV